MTISTPIQAVFVYIFLIQGDSISNTDPSCLSTYFSVQGDSISDSPPSSASWHTQMNLKTKRI